MVTAAIAIIVVAVELLSFVPIGATPVLSGGRMGFASSVLSTVQADPTGASQLAAAHASLASGGGPASTSVPIHVTAGTTSPTWSYAKQPSPRQEAMLTYDARDKYVLLFGGETNSAAASDTWTFAGGLWTLLHPAVSPIGRYAGAMTFDTADNYVLLFGGANGSGTLNDTWSFAGGVWTQRLPTTNPGALAYGSINYDARDGYVVFFGGSTAALAFKSATWEFKAGQWTLLSETTHPTARAFSSMAYDALDREVILFGGENATYHFVSDTWNFSGGVWSKLAPSPHPSARAESALAYSAKDSELVLFGGYTAGNVYLSDTWTFAGGAWTKIATTAHPSNRAAFGMADGTATTSVLLFGGLNPRSLVLNDTWTFNGAVWTHVVPRVPAYRAYPAMAYDEADGYVLLFGGLEGGALGDTWKFAHGVWTPLHPAVSPSPRQIASMTYDQADGYVVLFGGDTGLDQPLGDTWTFAGGSWTQQVAMSLTPSARAGAGMTYDYADGYVLLFGGENDTSKVVYNDTWAYSAGVWTRLPGAGAPSPRSQMEMAYDSEDGYVVLFSGEESFYSALTPADTWTFLGGTWTNITATLATSPTGAGAGAMVDDTYDGYLLMFGGIYAGLQFLNSTWSFVNGAWAELFPSSAPAPQSAEGLVFDPPDNEVVLASTSYPVLTTWTY